MIPVLQLNNPKEYMPSKKRSLAQVPGRTKQRDQQPGSLVEFFRRVMVGGKPLDLTRKRDTTRTLKW